MLRKMQRLYMEWMLLMMISVAIFNVAPSDSYQMIRHFFPVPSMISYPLPSSTANDGSYVWITLDLAPIADRLTHIRQNVNYSLLGSTAMQTTWTDIPTTHVQRV
jgi:hypothetical protein